MKIESHLENLEESIREIENAIKEGLEKKQRTLGFHTSSAAIDMLEIIKCITKIESARNKLCYGKRQKEEDLEEIAKEFNELKNIFEEVSGYGL